MNSTWLAEHVPAFVTVPTQLSLYCRRLSDSEPWLYQDRIMPSASLIKLPIMSALFRQEKEGALTLEERCTVTESVEGGSFYGRDGAVVALQELVFHMIVESDNTCANLLIERLGLDTIQAEIDRLGNINVSKFNGHVTGPGGFIDIAQNTKRLIFMGTFTAGGLKEEISQGKLHIVHEGAYKKFKQTVEQITFSAAYAVETGQDVLIVTERAVFRLTADGLVLTAIAPGIRLEEDVLAQMDFRPRLAEPLLTMDTALFT